MVWAAAGNLPEQNQNNKCVNRPPGTAVKKYAGTYDLPCTLLRMPPLFYNRGIAGWREMEYNDAIMPAGRREAAEGFVWYAG